MYISMYRCTCISLTGKLDCILDVINVIFVFLVNLQYDYDMPYV